MFGWFKKDKQKSVETNAPDLSDAKQALLAQMREKRAEIGEEELQKITARLKIEDMKKQVRHDIDHNEDRRNRLLDELRAELRG